MTNKEKTMETYQNKKAEERYYGCVFNYVFLGQTNGKYGCKNSKIVSEYKEHYPVKIIQDHNDIALLNTILFCLGCEEHTTEHKIRNKPNKLLTPKEAAEYLYLHINTVRRYHDKGVIPAIIINSRGDRRFRIEDLDKFLAERTIMANYSLNPLIGITKR